MYWTRRSSSTCEDFFGWLSETRRPSSRVESNAKSCLVETGKSFSKMRSLFSVLGWNTLMSPHRKSPVWVRHGRDLFRDEKSCQTHYWNKEIFFGMRNYSVLLAGQDIFLGMQSRVSLISKAKRYFSRCEVVSVSLVKQRDLSRDAKSCQSH